MLVVAGVMLAMFTSAMDQTLVGTALPRIVGSLGGLALFPWVFTAFMVSSTTIVPIVGRLTDIYGRKPFYLAALAILMVGSALAGLSTSMSQLIAFRALQGVGAGMIMSITFIIGGDLFPPAERSRYVGLFTGVFAAASVLGPLIGGALTDYVHWRWVFYVNLPLGALAMVAVTLFLPPVKPVAQKMALDWAGFVLLTATVVPLLLALSWGGHQLPWLSAPIIGMLGAVAILTVIFALVETRASWPVFPLSLLKDPVFAVVSVVSFLIGAAMFGAISFIPMFVQGVLGATATNSGLVTMPMTVALAISSTIAGQIVARIGRYKFIYIVGLAVLALSSFLFSQMDASTQRVEVTRNMVVMGAGLGMSMPILTLAAQNAVPYAMLGIATSSVQFIRQVGAVLGVAILGARVNAIFAQQLELHMPPELRNLPPQMASILKDPDFFLSPEAVEAMRARFAQLGEGGLELFGSLLTVVREALAQGIAEAFLVTLLLALAAVAVGLFLKEVPLKLYHEIEGGVPLREGTPRPAFATALQGFGDGPTSYLDPPPNQFEGPPQPPREPPLQEELQALKGQVAQLLEAVRRARQSPPTSPLEEIRQELRLLRQELEAALQEAPAPSYRYHNEEIEALRDEVRSLRGIIARWAQGRMQPPPTRLQPPEWARAMERLLEEVQALRQALEVTQGQRHYLPQH